MCQNVQDASRTIAQQHAVGLDVPCRDGVSELTDCVTSNRGGAVAKGIGGQLLDGVEPSVIVRGQTGALGERRVEVLTVKAKIEHEFTGGSTDKLRRRPQRAGDESPCLRDVRGDMVAPPSAATRSNATATCSRSPSGLPRPSQGCRSMVSPKDLASSAIRSTTMSSKCSDSGMPRCASSAATATRGHVRTRAAASKATACWARRARRWAMRNYSMVLAIAPHSAAQSADLADELENDEVVESTGVLN